MGGLRCDPLSLNGHDLLIVPDEARLVLQAYRLALEGQGLRRIGRALGWRVDRVRYVLRSPWYAGDYVWGRTSYDPHAHDQLPTAPSDWIVHRDHHPPIVPRAEWDRVQEILSRAGGRWGGHPHGGPGILPLSGLLVCARCGGLLSASGLSHARAHGRRWHYYACRRQRQDGTCEGVGHRSTDGWVPRLVATLADIYAERDLPERLHAALCRRPEDELAAAREIRRLERAVDGLVAVAASGLRGSAAARVAAEITAAQAKLDAARAAQRRDRGPVRAIPSVASIRALLRALSHDLRTLRTEPPPEKARPLLHRYLRRVTVSRTGVRAEVECGAVLRDSQAPGLPWQSLRRFVIWKLRANRKAARR
jgi:hypothetical protein